MTQKRRKADSGKAIGETTALRWEPTHITKPNPRVVPLQFSPRGRRLADRILTLSYIPFCDILCDFCKTIIGLHVNICQVP